MGGPGTDGNDAKSNQANGDATNPKNLEQKAKADHDHTAEKARDALRRDAHTPGDKNNPKIASKPQGGAGKPTGSHPVKVGKSTTSPSSHAGDAAGDGITHIQIIPIVWGDFTHHPGDKKTAGTSNVPADRAQLHVASNAMREAIQGGDAKTIMAVLREHVHGQEQGQTLSSVYRESLGSGQLEDDLERALSPTEFQQAKSILQGKEDYATRIGSILEDLSSQQRQMQLIREGQQFGLPSGNHDLPTNENDLLLTLSSMSKDEMSTAMADFQKRNHVGLDQAIASHTELSQEARAAAAVYFGNERSKNGQYSEQGVQTLATTALKQGNLMALRAAYSNTTDTVRKQIAPSVENALNLSALTGDEKEQAAFIIRHGETSLATQIEENRKKYGLNLAPDKGSANEKSIRAECEKLSDEQRKLYLSGASGADPEAVKYYRSVQAAIERAAKTPAIAAEWEDLIEHKGGSLISKLSPHMGEWMNDSPQEMLKTMRDQLSQQDVDLLMAKDSKYAEKFATYLDKCGVSARPFTELIQKIRDTAGDLNQVQGIVDRSKQGNKLNAALDLNVPNKPIKNKPLSVDAARGIMDPVVDGDNKSAADALIGALEGTVSRHTPMHIGHEPDYDRPAQYHPDKALQVVHEAFQNDSSLLEKINHPKTEEDKVFASRLKAGLSASLGQNNAYGKDCAQTLLNTGRLTLEQQHRVFGDNYWDDKAARFKDILSAPAAERQDARLRERLMSGLNAGQQAVLTKLLNRDDKTGPAPEDMLRACAVGLGESPADVIERFSKLSPNERNKAKENYRENYMAEPVADWQKFIGQERGDLIESLNQKQRCFAALDKYSGSRGDVLGLSQALGGQDQELDGAIAHLTDLKAKNQLNEEETRKYNEVYKRYLDSRKERGETFANHVMTIAGLAAAPFSGGMSLGAMGQYAALAYGVKTGSALAFEGRNADMSLATNANRLVQSGLDAAFLNVGPELLGMGKTAASEAAQATAKECEGYMSGKATEAFEHGTEELLEHGLKQGKGQITDAAIEQVAKTVVADPGNMQRVRAVSQSLKKNLINAVNKIDPALAMKIVKRYGQEVVKHYPQDIALGAGQAGVSSAVDAAFHWDANKSPAENIENTLSTIGNGIAAGGESASVWAPVMHAVGPALAKLRERYGRTPEPVEPQATQQASQQTGQPSPANQESADPRAAGTTAQTVEPQKVKQQYQPQQNQHKPSEQEQLNQAEQLKRDRARREQKSEQDKLQPKPQPPPQAPDNSSGQPRSSAPASTASSGERSNATAGHAAGRQDLQRSSAGAAEPSASVGSRVEGEQRSSGTNKQAAGGRDSSAGPVEPSASVVHGSEARPEQQPEGAVTPASEGKPSTWSRIRNWFSERWSGSPPQCQASEVPQPLEPTHELAGHQFVDRSRRGGPWEIKGKLADGKFVLERPRNKGAPWTEAVPPDFDPKAGKLAGYRPIELDGREYFVDPKGRVYEYGASPVRWERTPGTAAKESVEPRFVLQNHIRICSENSLALDFDPIHQGVSTANRARDGSAEKRTSADKASAAEGDSALIKAKSTEGHARATEEQRSKRVSFPSPEERLTEIRKRLAEHSVESSTMSDEKEVEINNLKMEEKNLQQLLKDHSARGLVGMKVLPESHSMQLIIGADGLPVRAFIGGDHLQADFVRDVDSNGANRLTVEYQHDGKFNGRVSSTDGKHWVVEHPDGGKYRWNGQLNVRNTESVFEWQNSDDPIYPNPFVTPVRLPLDINVVPDRSASPAPLPAASPPALTSAHGPKASGSESLGRQKLEQSQQPEQAQGNSSGHSRSSVQKSTASSGEQSVTSDSISPTAASPPAAEPTSNDGNTVPKLERGALGQAPPKSNEVPQSSEGDKSSESPTGVDRLHDGVTASSLTGAPKAIADKCARLVPWQQKAAKRAWDDVKQHTPVQDESQIVSAFNSRLRELCNGGEGKFYQRIGNVDGFVDCIKGLSPEQSQQLKERLNTGDEIERSRRLERFDPKTFQDALAFVSSNKPTEGAANLDHNAQIDASLKLTETFGPKWRQWLNTQKHMGRSLHDSVYWLPAYGSAASKDIGTWLYKNGQNKITELEMIAKNWNRFTTEQQHLPCKELVAVLRSQSAKERYPQAEHMDFASEATYWSLAPSKYRTLETRFLTSQDVPVPFPTEKTWVSGELTGRFLPRSDARGMFLGQHSGCCQHPEGMGNQCAQYGQDSINSGFFVVEDKQGKVIAQSWSWISDKGGLCFDSLEGDGKRLGGREHDIKAIYTKAAQDLSEQFGVVTLGATKIKMAGFEKAATSDLSPSADYGNGYRDSKDTQILLAKHGPSTRPDAATVLKYNEAMKPANEAFATASDTAQKQVIEAKNKASIAYELAIKPASDACDLAIEQAQDAFHLAMEKARNALDLAIKQAPRGDAYALAYDQALDAFSRAKGQAFGTRDLAIKQAQDSLNLAKEQAFDAQVLANMQAMHEYEVKMTPAWKQLAEARRLIRQKYYSKI